jgi:hypothetical protein
LRLEIRDFTGQVKDYSKEGMFPTADDFRSVRRDVPTGKLPWYDNLFVYLYFLDFLAIALLYRPYLRTFLRLKTESVDGCAIPDFLEPAKKLKLRRSIIYWEPDRQAIWLRPRGFILFQVPFTVAKLNTDEFGKFVTSAEVRFSSGFPFVTALLLWTMYQFLIASIPAGGPPPALFVGFFAVFILIGGFIQLRVQRSRMDALIHDVLIELKQPLAG